MDYSFNLDWDELDEELQKQKIDEYIEYHAGQEEHVNQDDAEAIIKSHFPIYF